MAKHDWVTIKKHFETGHMTQADIVKEFEVDKGLLSRKVKKEKWAISQLANEAISNSINLSQQKSTLSQQDPQMLTIVEDIADQKTKDIMFFRNSAMRNQFIIDKGIEEVEKQIEEKPATVLDHAYFIDTHSKVTQRNKDTVCGKEPKTEINNTNAQQNNTTMEVTVTIDE